MILKFRHKGLEKFFTSGDLRGITAQHAKKLRLLLGMLELAKAPSDMNVIGARLHLLKGDLKGFWAVNVSGNWRLIFRFDHENPTDVDLIDYH